MLTLERLKQVLAYDESTGTFTNLVARASLKAGARAGYVNARGYEMVRVDGHLYQAHRVAWFYVYGRWPEQQIDHINGRPADNRIANLRDVSPSINCQNKSASERGSLVPFLGVTKHKGGRYQAAIVVSGKFKHLGLFDTPELAHEAYMAAKRVLHPGYVERAEA